MIKTIRIHIVDPQDAEVAQAAEIITRELRAHGISASDDATSALEFSSRALNEGCVLWKSKDFEKNLPVETCAEKIAELK